MLFTDAEMSPGIDGVKHDHSAESTIDHARLLDELKKTVMDLEEENTALRQSLTQCESKIMDLQSPIKQRDNWVELNASQQDAEKEWVVDLAETGLKLHADTMHDGKPALPGGNFCSVGSRQCGPIPR